MNLKSKIFFITLVLSIYSCSSREGSVSTISVNGSKMSVVSLNSIKSDTATIPLSSLVEDCTLVQLETRDDAFFKSWFTTVTEKYIGVRDNQSEPYKLFDRSGKFLCNVGSRGQGPGEYSLTPYDDIIDDQNELIYLAPFLGDKILVYNTSGQFLKNIVSPQRMLKAKIFLSNDTLTVIYMPYNDVEVMSVQFNVNTGEVLKKLPTLSHFIVMDADGEIFNTRNTPETFDFLFTNSDTLYHFDVTNNKILPVFLMTSNTSENAPKQSFQLNKDLFLTNVYSWRINPEAGGQGLIYKGTIATDLKTGTASYIKIVNDYYGNLPVSASVVTFRNGYFVYNIQPEQLIDDIENRLTESSCTEDDRQVLQKTLSILKEGTNNLVFIGKLREEWNIKW